MSASGPGCWSTEPSGTETWTASRSWPTTVSEPSGSRTTAVSPDRRHARARPDVVGEALGLGLGEADAGDAEPGHRVFGGGGRQHLPGQGDGERGVGSDGHEGLASGVDPRHREGSERRIHVLGPHLAGDRVGSRESATGQPEVSGTGDTGLLALRVPHSRGVDRLDESLGPVDAVHRRAVLDDVEVGVEAGEQGAVELPDRLVDPAVEAVAGVRDPDAAVVELGLVGLVALGVDGVGGHRAEDEQERNVARKRRFVTLRPRAEAH